jgi:hypothetical protein
MSEPTVPLPVKDPDPEKDRTISIRDPMTGQDTGRQIPIPMEPTPPDPLITTDSPAVSISDDESEREGDLTMIDLDKASACIAFARAVRDLGSTATPPVIASPTAGQPPDPLSTVYALDPLKFGSDDTDVASASNALGQAIRDAGGAAVTSIQAACQTAMNACIKAAQKYLS